MTFAFWFVLILQSKKKKKKKHTLRTKKEKKTSSLFSGTEIYVYFFAVTRLTGE